MMCPRCGSSKINVVEDWRKCLKCKFVWIKGMTITVTLAFFGSV